MPYSRNIAISASSLSELIYQSCQSVLALGSKTTFKKGNYLELENIDLFLNESKCRHIYIPEYDYNIFASLAEMFWVFGGDGVLFPLMTTVNPDSIHRSDTLGYSLRGSHSKRIFTNNQIGSLLAQYKQEGLSTRRGVMALWRPDMDAQSIIGDCNWTRDIPKPTFIWTWVKSGSFKMKVGSRCEEVLSTLGTHILKLSILQELLSDMVGKDAGVRLKPSMLQYSVVSLQVDMNFIEEANKIISSSLQGYISSYLPCFLNYDSGYTKAEFFRNKFSEILNVLNSYATVKWNKSSKDTPETKFSDIEKIGQHIFGENYENNALYWYFLSVVAYLLARNSMSGKSKVKDWLFPLEDKIHSIFPDFHHALVNSPYYDINVGWTKEETEALDARFKYEQDNKAGKNTGDNS